MRAVLLDVFTSQALSGNHSTLPEEDELKEMAERLGCSFEDPFEYYAPNSAEGRFLIKRCDSCGEAFWYPRALCPSSHSDRTVWEESPGEGVIYTYSVMWRSPSGPYAIGYVTLDEGPNMLTNFVDVAPDCLSIGMRVMDIVGEPLRIHKMAGSKGEYRENVEEMLRVVGRIYGDLGSYPEARRLLEDALAAEPDLVIGVLEGAAEYQLYRVGRPVRLSDGRIAVPNSGSHEVRLFDASGRFLRSVGRLGSGPGEFGEFSALRLCVLPDGDSAASTADEREYGVGRRRAVACARVAAVLARQGREVVSAGTDETGLEDWPVGFSPDVVNRTIRLDGEAFTIAGVMPPGFNVASPVSNSTSPSVRTSPRSVFSA